MSLLKVSLDLGAKIGKAIAPAAKEVTKAVGNGALAATMVGAGVIVYDVGSKMYNKVVDMFSVEEPTPKRRRKERRNANTKKASGNRKRGTTAKKNARKTVAKKNKKNTTTK